MQESVLNSTAGPGKSKPRLVIVQTLALFVDAYRELNARRLFWIVLMISLLIAAGFGAVGINKDGIVVFWKTFPSDMFNTLTLDRAEIYKWMFSQLGINWWLTLIATVLALVSTAGIFPEFLSSGAIDLYLSKPIGRLRLFITKYLTGLIFVALQVLVFCISSFFVIGIRGGVWEPAIFYAVPLVLLFFSYLFALLVLLGILTRSAIAALLLTILCWIFTFSFHSTEVLLLNLSIGKQLQAQADDGEIQQFQQKISRLEAASARVPAPNTTQPVTFNDRDLQMTESSLAIAQQNRADDSDPFASWHRLLFALTYPLPKTTETIDLIKRELGERMHIRHEHQDDDNDEPSASNRGFFRNRALMRRAGMQTQQTLAARSDSYILGTSLAFEAAVVSLAAWIFCRRDF
jgi:ABC-type transport system involved in multi-copper enzyme maturation permease subunit